MKALLLAAIATMFVAVAGPAHAAPAKVKLRNAASGQLLTAAPDGSVGMRPGGYAGQTFEKLDTNPGFAFYAQGTQCLTGYASGPKTAVKMALCVRDNPAQMWRTNEDTGALILRSNSLALQADRLGDVRLAPLSGSRAQSWSQLPA